MRTELSRKSLDALIVSSLPHIRYLSGFTGSNALLIVTLRSAILLTDTRYTLQAETEVSGCRILITTKPLVAEAAARKLLAASARVGFQADQVTYAQYRSLRALFPSTSFVSTRELVEDVMLVKDADELEAIKRAVAISDKVFHEVLSRVRPGIPELEIAGEISYLHKKYGGERDAFETIVASGKRGAFPHARASTKKIARGELVTLDFGCAINGYHSDLTRTIGVGPVPARLRRMYNVVREAQQLALDAARGNMSAADLDAVARTHITRRGFGKYFTHSLGHGLGLNVHERPRVSHTSKECLRTGSVITIEPGVYIPDVGGVRIEDDVVLTDTGCVVLTTAPKDLTIV